MYSDLYTCSCGTKYRAAISLEFCAARDHAFAASKIYIPEDEPVVIIRSPRKKAKKTIPKSLITCVSCRKAFLATSRVKTTHHLCQPCRRVKNHSCKKCGRNVYRFTLLGRVAETCDACHKIALDKK